MYAYKNDQIPIKTTWALVSLKMNQGNTPLLKAVKQAEERFVG